MELICDANDARIDGHILVEIHISRSVPGAEQLFA